MASWTPQSCTRRTSSAAPLATWLAHQNPSNRRQLPLSTLGNLNPFHQSAPRPPRRPQSVPGLASAVATTHVTSPPSCTGRYRRFGLFAASATPSGPLLRSTPRQTTSEHGSSTLALDCPESARRVGTAPFPAGPHGAPSAEMTSFAAPPRLAHGRLTIVALER
jgi:hypothetical protein